MEKYQKAGKLMQKNKRARLPALENEVKNKSSLNVYRSSSFNIPENDLKGNSKAKRITTEINTL